MLPAAMLFRLFSLFAVAVRTVRWGWALGLALLLAATPTSAQAPADTLRIHNLLADAQRVPLADTARHRRVLLEVERQSRAARYAFGLGVAYNGLSFVASQRNDTLATSHYHRLARRTLEALYRKRPSPRTGRLLAALANNEANVRQQHGDTQGAARMMLDMVRYLSQARAYDLLMVAYFNLGGIFFTLDQSDKAVAYWEQALALRPHAPEAPVLVVIAASLANHYTQHGQPALARRCLALAKELSAQGPAAHYREQYLAAQGKYYLSQNQPQQGAALLDQALALARKHAEPGALEAMLPDVASAHSQLGHHALARTYLLEGMSLSREAGDVDLTVELENLAETEEKLGHPAQALAYYRRFHALHDSLNNVEVKSQINALDTRYQTRQQAQHIQQLQQGQRRQAAELRRQRQFTALTGLLAAALLGASGLGYVALRSRRRLQAHRLLLQARKIQALERERQLAATEAMLRGQDDERSRLARDLHDGLGGMLSTVKLYLGSVRGNMVMPEASAQLFGRSIDQLDQSIGELRRVARDLMPEALSRFGLVPALRDVCDAITHSQALQVQFQAYGLDVERLPQRTEVVVYRLVQELLNNVVKHAQARQVIVQLIRDADHVQLVVEDDGRGFDPATAQGGVGLRSIQARVDYLRGTIDIQSAPGKGTTTSIEFNL